MHPDPKIHTKLDPHGDRGVVSRITIDYPSRLNVLSTQSAAMLRQAIENASTNDELRVLVLTGAGDRAFIGGADIKEFAALDPDGARDFITGVHNVCQAIRDCPVPVIARIHGYCLGAGFEVAASCDLRVATTDSTFGMPEVKVGVPSVIEAALLPRLIGWGHTNELLLTGENIAAEEAASWGFLERIVDLQDLDGQVDAWVNAIVESAPLAVRAQKALIRRWDELPLSDAIQAGIDAFSDAYKTGEPAHYTEPFLNRRKDSSSN